MSSQNFANMGWDLWCHIMSLVHSEVSNGVISHWFVLSILGSLLRYYNRIKLLSLGQDMLTWLCGPWNFFVVQSSNTALWCHRANYVCLPLGNFLYVQSIFSIWHYTWTLQNQHLDENKLYICIGSCYRNCHDNLFMKIHIYESLMACIILNNMLLFK